MARKSTRAGCAAIITLHGVVIACFTHPAPAGVQEFEDEERPMWFDAASAKGAITTIGFDDLGANVLVTEQYADFGVHFTYLGNFTREKTSACSRRTAGGWMGMKKPICSLMSR